MSKFDYMSFRIGSFDTGFVAHAKKYTRAQVLALFKTEFAHRLEAGNKFRTPTIRDVRSGRVRFYVKAPDFARDEFPDGGYFFTGEGSGSFPVWFIFWGDLKT